MPKIPLDKEFQQLPTQVKIKYPKQISQIVEQNLSLHTKYMDFYKVYLEPNVSKFRQENFQKLFQYFNKCIFIFNIPFTLNHYIYLIIKDTISIRNSFY
jgi:hypothetical protein